MIRFCLISDLRSFQSTHLREVRRASELQVRDSHGSFNPRTYVRCDDDDFWGLGDDAEVSIHAPT